MVTTRSSRSSRSVNREVEAWRTDRTQGCASPLVASAQRSRTVVSTFAWCTTLVVGIDDRAAAIRSLPDVPRSRCSRRRGSGLSRETHAVSGQPVARRARMVVARRTASVTIGTPAASVSASTSSAWSLAPSSRGSASPLCSAICAAAAEMSPVRRVRTDALSLTRLPTTVRSASMPSPVVAEVASTGTPARPSASSSRRTSSSMLGRRSSGTSSMWLTTTSITSLWVAIGRRNRSWTAASAYFCGSSTQIIRSVIPISRSTSRWWLTSVESWSGRSSSTSPSSPLSC